MTQETAVGPRGAGAAAPGQRPPAPETTRLYATDWQNFLAWCAAAAQAALPVAGVGVAAFLTWPPPVLAIFPGFATAPSAAGGHGLGRAAMAGLDAE